MNRFAKLFAVIGFLVIAAHRLPAPIQETQETPTPRPVGTLKMKKSARPKQSDKSSASSEKKAYGADARKQESYLLQRKLEWRLKG